MLIRCLAIFLLLHSLDSLAASYPVDIAKGFIVTTAVIDGQRVNVILDSGAPGFILNEKYYSADRKKGIQCTGINGSFNCGIHTIRSWEWLGAEDGKTKALVSDLAFLETVANRPIHAIIGLNMLADYYVSIDYDNQMITLQKKIPVTLASSFSKINYVDHLPVISCRVNGQKKILALDTGSAANYLFNFDQKRISASQMNTTPVMVVGTDNREDLRYRISLDLQMPEEETFMTNSFIVDLKDQGQQSPDAFDGILGQEFLMQYNLIIHPGKQKMMLIPRDSKDLVLR